jgi:glyoxylase-like metal-dependent hydrolase (beta-lactamase superfamily II)
MSSVERMVTTEESAARAAAWFYTRQVQPGVWLIGEPQHVYSWLVEGSERAVLLDTGMGILPIRPVAEALTARPISVVNTHYHFDHIGGNREFEDVSIHEIGAPLAEQEVPRELLDAYLDYADRQLQAAATVGPLDREYLWLLGPESIPRPWPRDWNRDEWTIHPSRATHTLRDGDRIDLGDRVLTVIHAPGHSPDGICLFDERDGLLFAGDSSNAGPIYAHFPDSDLAQLTRSARRLADVSGDVAVAFFHHYGRPVAERDLFIEIATGLERIEGGGVELTPGVDIIGTPMLEARFDHFSVTLADPNAEAAVLTVEKDAS